MLYKATYTSTAGEMLILAKHSSLTHIIWSKGKQKIPNAENSSIKQHALINETAKQLDAYFAGKLQDFDLPLEEQGTEFQVSVWQTLREIPYGQTVSYKELAAMINKPKAVRAVGSANGKNPISIITPCHRVIAADGTLGGYAGGLGSKQKLLYLENAAFKFS